MAKAMQMLWVSTLAVTLVLGQNVYAQEAQKQTPPEGGTPKDFTLPAKQQFELDNGLKVTLVPFGSIPK
ncbi:insulinase family protein, partial [Pseudomonadota bacterium]